MFFTYGAMSVFAKYISYTTPGVICKIVSDIGAFVLLAVVIATFFIFPWWASIIALICSWLFGNMAGGFAVRNNLLHPYLYVLLFILAVACISIYLFNNI